MNCFFTFQLQVMPKVNWRVENITKDMCARTVCCVIWEDFKIQTPPPSFASPIRNKANKSRGEIAYNLSPNCTKHLILMRYSWWLRGSVLWCPPQHLERPACLPHPGWGPCWPGLKDGSLTVYDLPLGAEARMDFTCAHISVSRHTEDRKDIQLSVTVNGCSQWILWIWLFIRAFKEPAVKWLCSNLGSCGVS